MHTLLMRMSFIVALFALITMGVFARRGYIDLTQVQKRMSELNSKKEILANQLAALEREAQTFLQDPESQEKIIRQRLGYIRNRELVIEFE